VNPGPLVIIRDNRLQASPNHTLRDFRAEAAASIRRATLDTETTATIWALVLIANSWDDLPGWVQLAIARS
jgi:hypothetical protein